ncbi:MAG: glycosyltransferase [Vulcanimicrobiota bacterium]
MKTILFVINSLGGGGAERLLQTLAVELTKRGFGVKILTLENPKIAYSLPARVQVTPLWTRFLNFGPLKLLALPLIALELRWRLSQIKPDAWMSLLYRANFAAALAKLLGYKGRLVVSDHVDVFACYPGGAGTDWLMRILVRELYKLADVVLAVSQGVADGLQRLSIPASQTRTILNAVDVESIQREAKRAPSQAHTFVTVGRLCYQKDHLGLLQAFKKVHSDSPGARLIIVGEGPDRQELQSRLRVLGLESSVRLAGWRERPYELIAGAKAFVLSSRFEGFGLVLVEAMAAGLPVISTNCPSGPSEILGHGKYGIMVPTADSDALADAMLLLLNDDERCEQLKQKGLKRCQDFDVAKICDEYLELLLQQ